VSDCIRTRRCGFALAKTRIDGSVGKATHRSLLRAWL
jgi:hypothetical protein